MKFACKWNERCRLLHVSLLILLKRVIYLSLHVILKSFASDPRSRAVPSNTTLQSCLRMFNYGFRKHCIVELQYVVINGTCDHRWPVMLFLEFKCGSQQFPILLPVFLFTIIWIESTKKNLRQSDISHWKKWHTLSCTSFSSPFVTRCLFNLPTAQLHKSFYKLAQRSACIIGAFFLQTWNSSVYSQWCQYMVLCRLGVQLRYRKSSFTRRNQRRWSEPALISCQLQTRSRAQTSKA